MSEKIKRLFHFIIFTFVVIACVSVFGATAVRAEGEGDDWVHYPGTVTGNVVNVRTGAGTKYDQLQDDSGSPIQLSGQTSVTITDDAVADDGVIWYKVSFTKDGKVYDGFMSSTLVAKDSTSPITPSPAPSPTPEPTSTPTPTPDPDAKVTPSASKKNGKTDKTTADADAAEEGNSSYTVLIVIFAVIACFVVFFIVVIVLSIYKQNKKKKKSHTSRKVDRLKKAQDGQPQSGSGKRRPEIKYTEDDGAYVREYRKEVYATNQDDDDDLLGLINQENDDKKSLRAAVDRLQEHDIIIHKVYGEGEVYDNSDVKLMEVRFGNDVRFLNKDSIVSKKLVEVFDDEDQALARRRNKRKTTNKR